MTYIFFFFFQAEDGIRDFHVTGVQTCALPISPTAWSSPVPRWTSSRARTQPQPREDRRRGPQRVGVKRAPRARNPAAGPPLQPLAKARTPEPRPPKTQVPTPKMTRQVRSREVRTRRDHPAGRLREVLRRLGGEQVHLPGPPRRQQDRDQGSDSEDLER